MPQPKNTVARIVVPIVLIIAGVLIALSVFQASRPQPAPTPARTTPDKVTETAAGRPDEAGSQEARPAESAPTAAAPGEDAAPGAGDSAAGHGETGTPGVSARQTGVFDGLRAVAFADDPGAIRPAPIGSLDPQGDAEMQIEFSASGAGVLSLELADEFETIKRQTHERLQSETAIGGVGFVPFAAFGVEITPIGGEPVYVSLFRGENAEPVWRPIEGAGPGAFEAFVENAAGERILRAERRYSLAKGQHTLVLRQSLQNLSGTPYRVRWFQTGPVELPEGKEGYGGDKRRVRFGYLFPAAKDPSRSVVVSDDFLISRDTALGSQSKAGGFDNKTLWPNPTATNNDFALVWAGMTSRYFGVAVHPLVDPAATGVDKELGWVQSVERIALVRGAKDYVMAMRLDSEPIELAAGGSRDLSIGVFAGPLNRKEIRSEPLLSSLGLDGLVVYNFGGPCGFCTFGWLTGGLLWLLKTLHDFVVFDWALAIILLVVIVRTLLHPVTKWSQIRMQRFGKQMQGVAPKQKALQEKYKDDPKKLQQETAKLWREEGISPTGMLGCIPMFLQTPIWIALYATLYFAAELRHEPAFFGVFQMISKNWWFLGDLAEPDRLFYFGKAVFTVPLLGPIESINILPLVLGVVFFLQQKYLTPPTTATLTPEQEMQQKIIKVMMVVMFPVFMYNAPSGLAIYFIANSTLGILESRWIRSHIDKHDLLKPPVKKPRSGGPGFIERLQQLAEERQRQMQGGGKGAGKGGGRGQPPRKRV